MSAAPGAGLRARPLGRAARGALVPVVLSLVAVLAFGIATLLPLGLGPDEPPHIRYAGYLALEGALPDLAATSIAQAQHPPLYHAVIGALYLALRDDGGPPEEETGAAAPVVLPYERRVAIAFEGRIPDEVHRLANEARAAPDEEPRHMPRRTAYGLRWSGLVFALVTAGLVLAGVRRLLPDRRSLALLAGALGVLVPQFSAIFATINNDQFAVLFGTLGFALVLGGAARGTLDRPGRLLAAGACYALGFLSKLHVAGPFVAGAVLVWGLERRPLGRRARSLAVFSALPLVAAGTWVLLQVQANGSLHALAAAARHHPKLLRVTAPDAFALVDVLGGLAGSYLCRVGREALDPGRLWSFLAAAIPLSVLLASFAGLVARRAPRRDRWLAAAFLAGLLVQLGGILYGNLRFVHTHGRYLHPLVLPGAAALAAGLPHVLGRAARPVTGALAILAAAGGIVVLHGQLLPTYYAGHAIQEVPGAVAYVDLGTRTGDDRVIGGVPGHDVNRFYQRPRDRWRASRHGPGREPLRVRFDGLDPDGLHLLSLNVHAVSSEFDRIFDCSLDVLADGAQASGFLSPFGRSDWPSFPVRPSAVADGSFDAIVRAQSGVAAGVSEMLLRRLPLKLEGTAVEGDELVVRFREERDPWCSPHLAAALVAGGRRHGEPLPLGAPDAGGVRAVRLPLPPAGSGALVLALHLPESLFMDVKASAHAAEGLDVHGDARAPGLFVVDVAPGTELDDVVARVPGVVFPPNTYRFRFLDAEGRDVTSAMALRAGGRTITGPDLRLTIDRPLGDDEPLDFVFRGTTPLLLDRAQAFSPQYFLLDLRRQR